MSQRAACAVGSRIVRHSLSDLWICQKQSCVRSVYAVLTADPDGFRKPSSYPLSGSQRLGRSVEYLDLGSKFVHNHLAEITNSGPLSLLGRVPWVRFVAGEKSPDNPGGHIGHGEGRNARGFASFSDVWQNVSIGFSWGVSRFRRNASRSLFNMIEFRGFYFVAS